MLPKAFAVVEGENRDSWTWFLKLLIDNLGGGHECRSYTFILDQKRYTKYITESLHLSDCFLDNLLLVMNVFYMDFYL